MADTGSLWSFFGNDPSSGGGANYPALESRRRIALQLIAQGGKKGYPKTLGEGLTSIGDAIGDIGTMRALQRQEAEYQKYLETTAKTIPGFTTSAAQPSAAPRAEGDVVTPAEQDAALPIQPPKEEEPVQQVQAPPPPPPPPQSGYLTTQVSMPQRPPLAMDPTSQAGQATGTEFQRPAGGFSPNRPVTSIAPWLVNSATYGTGAAAPGFAAPPQVGPRSDAADYSYPPTASLQQDGIQSDAMPVGISPRAGPETYRDPIARLLLNGMPTAPGVPQPNPTVPGAATLPPTIPSPAAGGVDPRLAQAGPSGYPGVVTDIKPAPVMPQGNRVTPPVTMPGQEDLPLPQDTPMSRDEARARQMQMINPGDPNIKAMTDQIIAVEAAKRAQQDAQKMKQYELDKQLRSQRVLKQQEIEVNAPLLGAQTAKAQSDATVAAQSADLAQRFGREPAQALADFAKERDAAALSVNVLRQSKLAQEAIKNGIISGSFANPRTNFQALQAWMLNNKKSGDLAANSQLFEAAVKSTLQNAVQNIQGADPRVTDSDIRVASGTIGADRNMQQAAIERLIQNTVRSQHERLNTYEDRLHYYLGTGQGQPKESPVLRDYTIRTDETAPQPFIDRLLATGNKEKFDARFGIGAADLELARAKRRAGK